MKYDKLDINSILQFAKQLVGKSLRESCGEFLNKDNFKGKGSFGQTVEEDYFEYSINSESEPDFKEIGLEVKSSGLKVVRKNEYVAKERLVLSIINYNEIVNQTFSKSSFLKKNAHLLLIFYLYEKGVSYLDFIVKLVGDWRFSESDLEIIKSDWELIQRKVMEGKAHEISEGDTLYLGACSKGGKGGNPRTQPFNEILAKQRAFSLKQGYINHILAIINQDKKTKVGKIIESASTLKKISFTDAVLERFSPFLNKNVNEIHSHFGNKLNIKSKSFYSSLVKLVIGIKEDVEAEEFRKAEIEIKAVRIKMNNLPKENISFPAFHYDELITEEWEESEIKNRLEKKFLFVFFRFLPSGELVLDKVRFWNMPYADLQQVKLVWEKVREVVKNGQIVRQLKGNIRLTNFPSLKFNSIAHVRPHANNAADTFPLPVQDKLTGLKEYTKYSFWLNNTYIRDYIYKPILNRS
jgi:DNA mismatch repair protein MutH